MIFFKKKPENSESIIKILSKITEMESKIELLDMNYRLLSSKVKGKIGSLPTEDKEKLSQKDFYKGVLLPE